jgi:tetratricopeptide (TPR) repeat protein
VRREIGDLERALNDLAQAEIIFSRLMSATPEDFTVRRRLAESQSARANILQDLNRHDQAYRAYQESFDTLEAVAGTHASDPEFRNAMARMCVNRGEFLSVVSRPQEAEALLRRSIAIREELLKERPTDTAVRVQLARSWINLGVPLRAMGRGDDAEKAFQTAADLLDPQLLDKLTATREQLAEWYKARGHAFNNLGVVRQDAGRLADAADAIRISVKIKEQLAEQFPSAPQYRYELAGSYNNLGSVLSQVGQPAEARAAYERAVQIGERLVAASPEVPVYSVSLAGAYTNLGRHMGDAGELERSLPWLTKAVDVLEAQYRRDSRVAKLREALLPAHWARAMTLCGLERYQHALPDWDRAIELDDGHYFVSLRTKRASNLLNLNDHVRAATDAQAIADFQKATAQDVYLAASVFAQTARLAHDDKALFEQYSACAVAALRQAAAKGFPNPARWKDDDDLKLLRERADFQKMLVELGVKRE